MKSIDALLPANDGLEWFNDSSMVTDHEPTQASPEADGKSPAELRSISDVVFAGSYFDAVAFLADSKTDMPHVDGSV